MKHILYTFSQKRRRKVNAVQVCRLCRLCMGQESPMGNEYLVLNSYIYCSQGSFKYIPLCRLCRLCRGIAKCYGKNEQLVLVSYAPSFPPIHIGLRFCPTCLHALHHSNARVTHKEHIYIFEALSQIAYMPYMAYMATCLFSNVLFRQAKQYDSCLAKLLQVAYIPYMAYITAFFQIGVTENTVQFRVAEEY